MSEISYNDSASLYLIPTPIGNLDDITVRALKTLETVDFVLCEDTRETGKLLSKYNNKIIELRKTYPKCELPIKAYIYCTKGNEKLIINNNECNGYIIGEIINKTT